MHLDINRNRHHDDYVRTTLTLDPDIFRQLQELQRQQQRSFKEVVNQTLRRGLSAGEKQVDPPKPFRVQAHDCVFRPGVDYERLNQLSDQLETEQFMVDTRTVLSKVDE